VLDGQANGGALDQVFLITRYAVSRIIAPTTAATKPGKLPLKPIRVMKKPPIHEPAIPSNMVANQPPGS